MVPFVRDSHEDPTNLALVRSIHNIGRVMGEKTVTEFVENEYILNSLK
jgi:EAL domain-containing protein (putative c-di-GMP-specific phosphodiesterase class I)